MVNSTISTQLFSGPLTININSTFWAYAALSASVILALYAKRTRKSDGYHYLPGLPIIGSWAYFTRRYDFLHDAVVAKREGKISKFKLLNYIVVVATGEQSRRFFFTEKGLDIQQAYDILWGGEPDVGDAAEQQTTAQENREYLVRRLTALLRKDRLKNIVPELVFDLEKRMKSWPESGCLDPFDDIYSLVVQLTARALTVKELADDQAVVKKLGSLYAIVNQCTTPSAILFPWFPSRTRMTKKKKTKELYDLIASYVDKRKESGETQDDAVQALLDQGDPADKICMLMMSAIFSGVLNTGIIISWMLVYLHANPEWDAKFRAEIQGLLDEYSPDASIPIAERLAHIPIDAWDDCTPVSEALIAETIRITVTGVLHRRNIKEDLELDGKTLKKGDFLVYLLGDLHLNPEIHPEPFKWNPGRWMEDAKESAEGQNVQWRLLGWGAGHHLCIGMRFAKLELKLIAALFTNMFEYSRVDARGNPATSPVPQPDRNDLYRSTPIGGEYFLRYKRNSAIAI